LSQSRQLLPELPYWPELPLQRRWLSGSALYWAVAARRPIQPEKVRWVSMDWIRNEDAWRRLVAILTLDRTRPFFADLGLGFVRPDTAQKILQQWLHRYLAAQAAGTPRPRVIELIQALATEFGCDEAERFGRCAQDGYFLAHDRPLNQWRRCMSRWCRRPEVWRQLGLPAERSEVLRQECLEATSDEAVETASDAQPLSDWDLGVYAALGFDDDENDPLTSVTLTIDRIKFLHFWKKLAQELNERQREALLENARRMVAAEGSAQPLEAMPTERWPEC
jgi:hypothetical protein